MYQRTYSRNKSEEFIWKIVWFTLSSDIIINKDSIILFLNSNN